MTGATKEVIGLRELKKRRTRLTLIDAALDLFLAKGYEHTTIDEIAAAAQVSQRTFFRYFATKEDIAISLVAEFDEIMLTSMAAQPGGASPRTALLATLDAVLTRITESGDIDGDRFRRMREVIETTPALATAQLAHYAEMEKRLAAEVARILDTDADTDLRPWLLVGIFLTSVRVGFEDCARHDVYDLARVTGRVSESVRTTLTALCEDFCR